MDNALPGTRSALALRHSLDLQSAALIAGNAAVANALKSASAFLAEIAPSLIDHQMPALASPPLVKDQEPSLPGRRARWKSAGALLKHARKQAGLTQGRATKVLGLVTSLVVV